MTAHVVAPSDTHMRARAQEQSEGVIAALHTADIIVHLAEFTEIGLTINMDLLGIV